MTLLTYGTAGGDRGRCDERCYNAAGSLCRCCCGGANHGRGRAGALEITRRQIAGTAAGPFGRAAGGAIGFPARVRQAELFAGREAMP